MKATIKIKVARDLNIPTVIAKGDWIDLRSDEDVTFNALEVGNVIKYISLGVAIELPEGYEAVIAPRSSTPKNYGIIMSNSIGVIDNSYCGDNDIWKFPALAYKETTIHKNDRIAQFRIQLSQKATIWQKIKWLFTSGVKIQIVQSLSNNNRGGFGSTGKV